MGGIEKSNIYLYFKVLYGLGNIFLGGGSSDDMEFGASNCMFEFSTLVHIMLVLSDKYMGSLSAELILSLIYMSIIVCGLVNTYEFWIIECYSISVLYFLLLEICTCGSLGLCFYANLCYWKDNMT